MQIVVADKAHVIYADTICESIAESAKVRGTGIAKRTPAYITEKIEKGNAVIALDGETFAGFCYIETWDHGKFVANSGLIVHPDYRGQGLARQIKHRIFKLSREKFPDAKVFSITTGLAVMKMNSELGYSPVTFSELTTDPSFWKGCQTCKNFDVLVRTNQSMCLCTGMLYDPKKEKTALGSKTKREVKSKVFQRLKQIKHQILLKGKDEDEKK